MKEQGQVIYVGKAINLKNRVKSYFDKQEHTPKVRAMVSHVDDFDICLARTNLEALLLECNLIKLHRPFYNIRLKDDKAYPYLRLDKEEPFAKLTLARQKLQDKAMYFGPFMGASALREVQHLAASLFPLRTCKLTLPPKKPLRPCLNYEMGRCLAPCANLCTKAEYDVLLSQVEAFLKGKYEHVLKQLTAEMMQAAKALQYEKAGAIKQKIQDIQTLMQRQQVQNNDVMHQDIIAIAQDDLDAMAQVLFIRDGKMIGMESFALQGMGNENKEEILRDFLLLYYDTHIPPRQVLVDCDTVEEDLEAYLTKKREKKCDLLAPKRGDKRALILLCEKNANDALFKRNQEKKIKHQRTIGACEELGKILGMTTTPRRIEGYDISNTQGILSVGAMVVFIDGEPAKKEYRHYRIKTVEGPNDFASMNEVINRRFARIAQTDEEQRWVKPDLILIDGGPQQLAFAQNAMHKHGINVPMFGLAKRLEEIFLPNVEESIYLDRKSVALHLIQRIRDEAHRFGITHHTTLRGKQTVHSQLEDIPDIGATRRRALFQAFKSLKGIKEATVTELASLPCMNLKAAQNVYDWAHQSDAP